MLNKNSRFQIHMNIAYTTFSLWARQATPTGNTSSDHKYTTSNITKHQHQEKKTSKREIWISLMFFILIITIFQFLSFATFYYW